MTGRLACVTFQDVGCVGRRRPGGPALSGLLSLRGSGRLVQRHERLSLRSPRSSGRERGLRAGGLVACRRSSFFRLLVQSSVPSCAPVVVKREPISSSCGDSLVRRARPAPGSAHAQSLVLDLNAGRRAPPAVRGRLRRDAAAAAAGNGRSGVGRVFESRRRPAFRCRAASVAMFALPRAGVRSSGTSPDRRRRYCAASACPSPCGGRYAFHGVRSGPTHGPSQPAGSSIGGIDPSLAAVARKSASYRVQIAVTAGRAAGTGTDGRLPRCRFTNDRRPRLLTFPSIVRLPLSRFTVFSLFPPVWSCPAARRPVPQ